MAGGPVAPISVAFDTNGRAYPGEYVGGTNSRRFRAFWLVEASLGADTDVWVLIPFPQSLPTGTCKCRLLAMANATSGSAKVTPTWASVAAGENPDTMTLNTEGQQTLTWSTGNNDDLMELEFNLDADTPVAGEYCMLRLQFNATGYTLAQVSAWWCLVVWE